MLSVGLPMVNFFQDNWSSFLTVPSCKSVVMCVIPTFRHLLVKCLWTQSLQFNRYQIWLNSGKVLHQATPQLYRKLSSQDPPRFKFLWKTKSSTAKMKVRTPLLIHTRSWYIIPRTHLSHYRNHLTKIDPKMNRVMLTRCWKKDSFQNLNLQLKVKRNIWERTLASL
jgi:hypothetical protein